MDQPIVTQNGLVNDDPRLRCFSNAVRYFPSAVGIRSKNATQGLRKKQVRIRSTIFSSSDFHSRTTLYPNSIRPPYLELSSADCASFPQRCPHGSCHVACIFVQTRDRPICTQDMIADQLLLL
jgi:hypothetical protein